MELANHFLLSMPTLEDPNFQRTLTYVCDHSEDGAMGLVVNRPLAITVAEILCHLEIESVDGAVANEPVYQGGPVETERGFVLHSPVGDWQGSLALTEDLAVTTSRDVLEALARGDGPTHALVTLGYSGWASGQLEAELAQNAWLTCPARHEILFDVPPERRLEAAAADIGIDLERLSSGAGHA
jgi:putative transcriptional regulator